MFKKIVFLSTAVFLVASCKPKKETTIAPDPQEEQTQQETAATINRQYNDGSIYDAIKCSDGNIVALATYPERIVKLSATDGSLMWARDMPLTGLSSIKAIAPAPKGGFVVSGKANTGIIPGGTLIAFDANGNELWNKYYSEPDWFFNSSIFVAKTGDNELTIVCGANKQSPPSMPAIVVIKVDGSGNELSWKINEGKALPYSVSLIGRDDHSLLMHHSNKLFKFDAHGEMTDSLLLPDANGNMQIILSIAQMADGGFICCGTEGQTHHSFIMHISAELDLLDRKSIAIDTLERYYYHVTAAKDGAILVGLGSADDTATYPIAMKVDNGLKIQWQHTFPAINNKFEELLFVTEVNGRYVAAGSSWNPLVDPSQRKHFLMDFSESGKAKE